MNKRIGLVAVALVLPACSGGGGATSGVPGPTAASGARTLSVAIVGTPTRQTAARTRAAQAPNLSGSTADVAYNGHSVGHATIDANDRATIPLDSSVPAGARVVATLGSLRSTIVLAKKTSGTISTVTVEDSGQQQVSSTDDTTGSGTYNPDDNEDQQRDMEGQQGEDEANASNVATVRAVHASPDAGPVDIYVYPQGTSRPTEPTIDDAAYPQITSFEHQRADTYTIDVLAHGAPSTATAVATQSVTLNGSTAYSVAVAGRAKASPSTLQFVDFVEPTEAEGQSALVVHHASPTVQGLVAPVGVGIYDDSQLGTTPPTAAQTLQVFAFSLTSPSGPVTSGAFPGSVVGGEYFLSPITGQSGEPALPSSIGFAAGAPGAGALKPLGSVATSANIAQLAAGLQNPTEGQQTLAADAASTIPAGAHVSIFAIDAPTGAALIGTLDR